MIFSLNAIICFEEFEMAKKEHFNFDFFMNQMERAVLAAQKTAIIAEKQEDPKLIKAARDSLKGLRKARKLLMNPWSGSKWKRVSPTKK